jgi:hypothetical protein
MYHAIMATHYAMVYRSIWDSDENGYITKPGLEARLNRIHEKERHHDACREGLIDSDEEECQDNQDEET